MFVSRFCIPYTNQRSAERQYAAHDRTETPAAWRPIQIVQTCGMVIKRVNTDIAPTRRRSSVWGPGWVLASGGSVGGMFVPFDTSVRSPARTLVGDAAVRQLELAVDRGDELVVVVCGEHHLRP